MTMSTSDRVAVSPKRRKFSAGYKARIVAEYDAMTEHGARGALLRREGLYDSHVSKWREAQAAGRLADTPAKGDTPASDMKRLAVENARLRRELDQTRTALEIVGKVHALLGSLSESADPEATSPK